MKRDPNQLLGAGRVAAAEVVADLIATVIATAAAAVAGAEIRARVAGSRLKIIAIVPGSLANLAGNAREVPKQLCP